ncbi:hypothetical protein F5Y16DRAFT_404217 [Xylariaceae sp. FL0255]|nr:hypothetical protein F5Y16DRAFT_404217 [Xylariaceae sp. FL0255]
MSFGSTEPTPESRSPLQLQWDCGQNEGTTRRLVDSWIAATDGKRKIDDILQVETSQVTSQIESLLRFDPVHFERVRSQLYSLLIAWEQVILEKRRYDEVT